MIAFLDREFFLPLCPSLLRPPGRRPRGLAGMLKHERTARPINPICSSQKRRRIPTTARGSHSEAPGKEQAVQAEARAVEEDGKKRIKKNRRVVQGQSQNFHKKTTTTRYR